MRFALALLTTLAMSAAALAQKPPDASIRVVTLYPQLPAVVAQDHGFFAKHQVEVQTDTASSSDALRSELASGKADLAHAAVDNAVAMVGGGTDVVIVMGGEGSINELIAQPGISAISALHGHTVIVDAPNTAYALQLKKILLMNGLRASQDYEIKPVGATPQRLQAMKDDKSYAASMLGPPTSVLAKSGGFVSLGSTADLIGPYQATGAFVQRSWARQHGEILQRYLAAYIEAQRWLMAPENKQQVLGLIAKQWHLSETQAADTYSLMIAKAPVWYETDARLDIQAFENVLKLRAEIEGQWGGHPPLAEKYYDPAYYQAALAELK